MNKHRHIDIQLVITVALKKEIDIDWFTARDVPVHTLEAVQSGALSQLNSSHRGILVLITGAGMEAGSKAACWIRDNIAPLYVLNIGTCGLRDRHCELGTWIIPGQVANEESDSVELDTRLPIPFPGKACKADALLSVKKASPGKIPDSWKNYALYDMECYGQAKIFQEANISFHCLKFSTDYSDAHTLSDFNRNLELFKEETIKLFHFAEQKSSDIRITAVVPVYNREHTVRRALDSILSQSSLPQEIIVIDDGSDDRTGAILESYGNAITTIYLSRNSGPSKARNEGIEHAHTEWIAFLDSDDSWEKDKLKGQIDYLQKYPFYEILQSEEVWIRKGKRVNPCKHHKKPQGWIWEPSLERCLVSPSGVLIKKSLLQHYGNFDEDLPVCEDYDLWLKIARHHPVGLEPSLSVIKYGGHDDQLSHRFHSMDRFRVQSLRALLSAESHQNFRQKIIHVLLKKLTILMKGYEKRGKKDEAEQCREVMKSIGQEKG